MTRQQIHERWEKWHYLFHEKGLTYIQIARLYNVPKSTVIGGIKQIRKNK